MTSSLRTGIGCFRPFGIGEALNHRVGLCPAHQYPVF